MHERCGDKMQTATSSERGQRSSLMAVERQRLLDQDMLAVKQSCAHKCSVCLRGRDDHNDVDVAGKRLIGTTEQAYAGALG
jgi:hypothetical protein